MKTAATYWVKPHLLSLQIKRPYFHVKPLERGQLRNWREYLDFEVSQGNQRRIITLFERCMIACALYEDFWSKVCQPFLVASELPENCLFDGGLDCSKACSLKPGSVLSLLPSFIHTHTHTQFAKYAEEHCPDYADSVYTRACTIHLQQKPAIHVAWAAYEEKRGETEHSMCRGLTARVLHHLKTVKPSWVAFPSQHTGSILILVSLVTDLDEERFCRLLNFLSWKTKLA